MGISREPTIRAARSSVPSPPSEITSPLPSTTSSGAVSIRERGSRAQATS